MKNLIVGGTFDGADGKPSKIVATLAEGLNWKCLNGGSLESLSKLKFEELDSLLWMPNISNDEEKILPNIKKVNPKLLLIQSKRVIEKSYTESDIIGRLLASHASLGIMITNEGNRLHFKLLDPLGNQWADTGDVSILASAISRRVTQLQSMRRVGCHQVGLYEPFQIDDEFLQIVRSYGNKFTQYVNAVNPNRLLGNASTRCTKGFPSQRGDGRIYVTRRNVDKVTLSSEDFVAVLPLTDVVNYYGEYKPSVDTPVQLRLFQYYPKINYMLHGHVYVETGTITKSKIPCGYIEEFEEITGLMSSSDSENFCINLKGHGCLILASNLEYFRGLKLLGRPFPEK